MATNDPAAYGLTLDCLEDVDEAFSTIDGVEGVVQDAIHRITNATVLGPGGDDWGIDVTKFAGMPASLLARQGPIVSEVLQRDTRIKTADVDIAPVRQAGSLVFATMTVSCTTGAGPFRRVFALSSLSVDDITAELEVP
jgi:hypothetical protein